MIIFFLLGTYKEMLITQEQPDMQTESYQTLCTRLWIGNSSWIIIFCTITWFLKWITCIYPSSLRLGNPGPGIPLSFRKSLNHNFRIQILLPLLGGSWNYGPCYALEQSGHSLDHHTQREYPQIKRPLSVHTSCLHHPLFLILLMSPWSECLLVEHNLKKYEEIMSS